MLGGQREANLAVALLQLKGAWRKLCEASKALDEYDFSELYPFYLLDFENIEPAVVQWCTVHASKLMRSLPDKVDNPTCLDCAYFRSGLLPDGLCKGFYTMSCGVHPVIVFSVDQVMPALIKRGVSVGNLSVDDIHLLYMKECNDHERKMAEARGKGPLRADDT